MSASSDEAPTTFEHRVALGLVGSDVTGLEWLGIEGNDSVRYFTIS